MDLFFYLGFLPGGTEWVVIFVVFLLLFGSSKIPEFAKGLGKAVREFQKAKSEFDNEIKNLAEQTQDHVDTLKSDLIRTPESIVSSEGKLLAGTFTGDGRVQSPHSDFAVEVDHRMPGDKVFDANTGKPFLIPDPLVAVSVETPSPASEKHEG